MNKVEQWKRDSEKLDDLGKTAVARSANPRPKDETGWLCELKNNPPLYHILPEPHWTAIAGDALRFARRVDAEAYIADMGWTEVVAVEHMWTAQMTPSHLAEDMENE